MSSPQIYILLADDDLDDCAFFKKALGELPVSARLTIVNDGEQLIKNLTENPGCLPDIIFLDLSMPRKTGFECLTEIKQNVLLKDIPVFVFSTSFTHDLNYEHNMIDTLSKIGAQEYIRKPGDYEQLKRVIHNSLKKIIKAKANGGEKPIDENAFAQPAKNTTDLWN